MNIDAYAKDDRHPITAVDVCDVEGERKGGGADLVVVLASAMSNDQRSRMRLMRKLENYLGYIRSNAFEKRYGSPSPANTKIVVRYHSETDAAVLELLNQCRGWVEDNGASLLVEPI